MGKLVEDATTCEGETHLIAEFYGAGQLDGVSKLLEIQAGRNDPFGCETRRALDETCKVLLRGKTGCFDDRTDKTAMVHAAFCNRRTQRG